MRQRIYISLSGENRIACLDLVNGSDKLSHAGYFETGDGPAPLALDQGRQRIFAGLRASRKLASYHLDPHTGDLSLIGEVDLDSDPCYLATDRHSRFLLATYYVGGYVTVHRILPDGSINRRPVVQQSTARGAHCIQTDPSNRFLFVSHPAESNVIYQFRFNTETGTITPNEPLRLEPYSGLGPRHYAFHPSIPIVYVVNEQGSSLTSYALDRDHGLLSEGSTVSTLPVGYRGENTGSQIHIRPDGRFLYTSNRGHDSIACFGIAPRTGAPTMLDLAPTEQTPRAFHLDLEGRLLFAAGLESGTLAVYRIDPAAGTLRQTQILSVGDKPMWVLPVALS